jgi:ABC-type uncharacterized transport system auxiliary subunit
MMVKLRTLLFWAALFCLVPALLLVSGCGLPKSRPPIQVKQWTLEYPAPKPGGAKLHAELKVMRFQAVQAFLGAEMVYRPDPNERGFYNYNRWFASPSDLVGDFLLRDLRSLDVVAVVYSNRQPQRPRFMLEGGVEEFLEVDDGQEWHAALKVNLTLLDTKQHDVTKRLLFQRDYTLTAPMQSKDPAGLAKAMSQAMAQFSEKARADILEAIEEALKTPLPEGSGD